MLKILVINKLGRFREKHIIKISMTLIAIFFPFFSFLLRGKIFTSIICLILQITLIGWIPAAIWAVISLQNSRADKRNEKLMKSLKVK